MIFTSKVKALSNLRWTAYNGANAIASDFVPAIGADARSRAEAKAEGAIAAAALVRDHPNRGRSMAFVIQLAGGRLWKERGANQAAVFGSLENARHTIASTKIEALKLGKPMRIAAAHEEGARFTGIEGYWIVEV